MRRCSRLVERQNTVGDHPPFAFRDASGCLKQADALGGQLRCLDFNEVIKSVERQVETVSEHGEEVVFAPSFLTDRRMIVVD
jgi:hypothetical protein